MRAEEGEQRQFFDELMKAREDCQNSQQQLDMLKSMFENAEWENAQLKVMQEREC